MHHDVTMAARAALCRQTAALAGRAPGLAPRALAGEVESLRQSALVEGLVAADRVCRAFTAELAGARRPAGYAPWFAALEDAIGCTAADGHAIADTCLAAVMVRMA